MALITCPECGKEVSEKANSCPNCGNILSQQNTNQHVNNQIPPPPIPNQINYQNMQQGKNSGLGVASLILSIIGCTFFVGAILAIIDLCQKNGKKKTCSVIALIVCAFWIILYMVFSAIGKEPEKNSTNSNLSNTESTAKPPESVKDPLSDDIIDVDISDCHIKYLKHEITENMSGDKCVAVYYEFTNNSDEGKAFLYNISDKAFQNGIELESSMFHVNDDSKNKDVEIKPGISINVCSSFVLRDEATDIELEIGAWITLKDKPDDKMVLSITE